MTSLHYASEKGHTEVVKILLDGGGDLDIRDKVSRTT
jgi:ankyrin repeat protein